jgi:predicted ABC-type ATPase
MGEMAPSVIVLAGPNGAGKTTASRTVLAETLRVTTFVNADVIAQGLAGFDPDSAALEASRIMLERLHALAAKRADFAFETTLAGRTYVGWLRSLGDSGYFVQLAYFWLNSADLAVARVAERVRQGGHGIPEKTIRQRYERSLANFFTLYRPLISYWQVYDNSQGPEPELIASGSRTEQETVINAETWDKIQRSYRNE